MTEPVRASAVGGILLLVAAGCSGGGNEGDIATPTTSAPETTVSGGPAVSSGPSTVLAIVSPATGAEVRGNVVRLDVAGSGLSIVAADGDISGKSGHFHVFVDRDSVEPGAVIPVEDGIIHTTDDPIVVSGLRVGPHRLTVVYGDGAHRRVGLTEAGTSFTVTGPSIDASATLPTVAAGQPVVVDVAVEGLTLPADAVLYVLVDRDAPPGGVPLPDEPGIIQSAAPTISVPGLGPGTHTLRVVAGSPERVPLDPPVMDEVRVTVT